MGYDWLNIGAWAPSSNRVFKTVLDRYCISVSQ